MGLKHSIRVLVRSLRRSPGGAAGVEGTADLSLTAVHPKLAGETELPTFTECAAPAVSIIVPAFGELPMTLRCLRSIARAQGELVYEVILIDDGSEPSLAEALAAIPGLEVRRNLTQEGFVGAANRGARLARGDHLVFLNNDTVVGDGWLDALYRRATSTPGVGLVGAQLVSPTGLVQEAGGIIWADASATNYGRGLHPDAPEVAYCREVDYCSAACLLISRSLFEELGGFDEGYAPGYYEDVDLSFKARARGLSTIYEPAARVHHVEGATAGTDPESGMKRFQERNRKLFAEHWRVRLEDQSTRAVPVRLAKDRGADRRCLVIDHRMPKPDRDAGSRRLVRMLSHLAASGWKVTLAPYDLVAEPPDRRRLEAQGIEVIRAPYFASIEAYLKLCGSDFDAVVLSRVGVARLLIGTVRKRAPKARVVFDTVDLKSVRDLREAELKQDGRLRRRAEATRRQELEVMGKSDVTLVTSSVERDYLRRHATEAILQVVPTWYPFVKPQLGFERRSGALFIGGFRHQPNLDAMLWFGREILPRVRDLLPQFRLHVIGEDPPRELRAFEVDGMECHGHVPDVSSFFQRTRLSIAPLRFGAGLKGKVHQSLASGLPCVATPVAAEGLGLMPNLHVVLADEVSEFANAIFRVHSDEDLWQRLSIEGQNHVERYFSEGVMKAGLAAAFSNLG